MEEIDVKQSLYIYNSGDLKRKDNTLRFTNYEGEREMCQLKEFRTFMLCQKCHLIQPF